MNMSQQEAKELTQFLMKESNKLTASLFDIVYTTLDSVAVDFDGVKVVSLPALRQAMDAVLGANDGEHLSTES